MIFCGGNRSGQDNPLDETEKRVQEFFASVGDRLKKHDVRHDSFSGKALEFGDKALEASASAAATILIVQGDDNSLNKDQEEFARMVEKAFEVDMFTLARVLWRASSNFDALLPVFVVAAQVGIFLSMVYLSLFNQGKLEMIKGVCHGDANLSERVIMLCIALTYVARLRVASVEFAEASKHMKSGLKSGGSNVACFDSVLGLYMMLDHTVMQVRGQGLGEGWGWVLCGSIDDDRTREHVHTLRRASSRPPSTSSICTWSSRRQR